MKEKLKISGFIKNNQLDVLMESGFSNYSGNSINSDALVLNIGNLFSLQKILGFINNMNQSKQSQEQVIVRVAAGGKGSNYSASYSVHGPVEAEIIIRLTGKEFFKIYEIDKVAQTITVGPNVQIGDAEKILAKDKLALSTTPLNPYITLVGLATYGGVGTGVDQPIFSGLLTSYTLCLQDGKMLTIDESHPDFHTLSAANCGLLGVIVKATFRCCDNSKLQLTETPVQFEKLIDKIKNKDNPLFRQKPYTSVFIVPDFISSDFNARIYQWEPVPHDTPEQNVPTVFRHYWQELQTTLVETLKIPSALNHVPALVPYFMQYIMKPAVIGSQSNVSIGPAHILFHHQTGYLQKGIEDVGWAIPDDGTGKQTVQALERIVHILRKKQLEGQFPVTEGGIYLRYIKGSKGVTKPGLSMCSTTAYTGLIDIVSNKHAPGFETLQADLTAILQKEFNAAPHLGKFLPNDYRAKNSNEFVDSLKRFYQANNLSFEKNLFLTTHFCHVLGISERVAKTQNILNHSFFDRTQRKKNTSDYGFDAAGIMHYSKL